ncbi:MAG: peptidylprolyl isomerase [Flavobacteriales bacterium]
MKRTIVLFVALFIAVSSFSQEKQVKVKIQTQYGEMVAVLYNETPQHRDNFLKLVKNRFYDGTIFHRVIPGFMIQGGDPASKNRQAKEKIGNGGPGYTIPAEFNKERFHKRGALAAARMPDAVNPNKESSGSQFYIVQGQVFDNQQLDMMEKRMGEKIAPFKRKAYMKDGGTPHLDGGYTVFGELITGLDVISKISNLRRDKNNLPSERVEMKITIIK